MVYIYFGKFNLTEMLAIFFFLFPLFVFLLSWFFRHLCQLLCRSCHLLSLLLEELEQEAAALHSFKSQSSRLSALHRFKSGQATILLATDVASRGLDIPTVDLVINYDIPRLYSNFTISFL